MNALSLDPPLALQQTLRQRRLLECGRPIGAEGCLLPATLVQAWRGCQENPASSAAWEGFLRLLLPHLEQIIARAAWRWGLQERADLDDVLQDICLKVCQLAKSGARLPSEEGALEVYFKAMAVNAARDWGRRRGADKRSQDVTVPIESHLHELAGQIRGGVPMEREILVRQIEERLAGSRRDVAVFWLYYRQGLSAPEIAAIPAVGLSVKGVESLIHRMVGSLRERLK